MGVSYAQEAVLFFRDEHLVVPVQNIKEFLLKRHMRYYVADGPVRLNYMDMAPYEDNAPPMHVAYLPPPPGLPKVDPPQTLY